MGSPLFLLEPDVTDEQREAKREYMRRYHADPKHKESALIAKARYRERHKEQLAEKELERYYENHDENKAKAAQHREENREAIREKHREYSKEWREENREKLRAYMRDYMKTPEQRLKNIDIKGRRRAKERGSRVGRIDWKHVVERGTGTCPLCQEPLTVGVDQIHFDHIIPLAAGGPHVTENLQVTHARCNLSKNKYGDGVLYPPKPKAPKKKYVNTELDKERQKAWRAANPDRQREFERAYRERHREKIRLRLKEWKAKRKLAVSNI